MNAQTKETDKYLNPQIANNFKIQSSSNIFNVSHSSSERRRLGLCEFRESRLFLSFFYPTVFSKVVTSRQNASLHTRADILTRIFCALCVCVCVYLSVCVRVCVCQRERERERGGGGGGERESEWMSECMCVYGILWIVFM